MIDLYTWGTPNGRKVSIMLEELGLEYTVHPINITQNQQFTPEFLAINPNNKIPAIVDQEGPGGAPLAVFESGAILIYLAEKTESRLLPASGAGRYAALEWLMLQMGGVGPMFGQLGFFHKFAGKDFEDKRPRDRYVAESKRLLGVLEQRLTGRNWILGDDYSIASQLLIQAEGVVITIVWSGVVAFIAYKIVDLIMGLRVSEESEREGLDITSHGETAYNR